MPSDSRMSGSATATIVTSSTVMNWAAHSSVTGKSIYSWSTRPVDRLNFNLVVTPKTAADLELAGGNLALDLANTRDGHAPARDYLETHGDLEAWAQHAAGLEIDADGTVLARVLELRDTVDAIFRAVAAGDDPGS